MKRNSGFYAVVLLTALSATLAQAATIGPLALIGDSTYRQFTPVGSSRHYQNVDEPLCNGRTDFNYTLINDGRDTYRVDLSAIPNGATITDITISPCAGYLPRGLLTSLPIMRVSYSWNSRDPLDGGPYIPNSLVPIPLPPTNFGSLSFVKNATSTLDVGVVHVGPQHALGISGLSVSNLTVFVNYSTSTAPIAPTNLTATSTPTGTSTAFVRLDWQDNSTDELAFRIDRGTSPASFAWLTDVPADTTTYTDNAVIPGTAYFYRVYAINGVGNSGYSNTVRVVAQ